MNTGKELIPVLQLDDLEALEAAEKHLNENGYETRIGPFEELQESEIFDWMIPSQGGFMFYLEKDRYQPAMELLGEFFGYTED
jgi:hypothetical protein